MSAIAIAMSHYLKNLQPREQKFNPNKFSGKLTIKVLFLIAQWVIFAVQRMGYTSELYFISFSKLSIFKDVSLKQIRDVRCQVAKHNIIQYTVYFAVTDEFLTVVSWLRLMYKIPNT